MNGPQISMTFGDDRPGGRRCGDCTLCCRLVPVEGLDKPAGRRCRFQSRKGCSVYHKPGFPPECGYWSCRWLVDPDAHELRRPDRARYVVDIMPDFIGMRDDATGAMQDVPVLVVWCDPEFPDAWRDPALRRLIEALAEREGMAALIRFGSGRGIAVFPPPLSADGQWHERASNAATDIGWKNPLDPMRRDGGLIRRRDGYVSQLTGKTV